VNNLWSEDVERKDEEIEDLHKRIDRIEQENKQYQSEVMSLRSYLAQKLEKEQDRVNTPETPQEALLAVLEGLEVVCDYDTLKRVESAVHFVDRELWVEGRYRIKLAEKEEISEVKQDETTCTTI
jgi:regulator of replication initiation timing